MRAYLISFQLAHGTAGTSFANTIFVQDHFPTSHEVRAAELTARVGCGRLCTSATALNIVELGD